LLRLKLKETRQFEKTHPEKLHHKSKILKKEKDSFYRRRANEIYKMVTRQVRSAASWPYANAEELADSLRPGVPQKNIALLWDKIETVRARYEKAGLPMPAHDER
jgi:hypothetical protein